MYHSSYSDESGSLTNSGTPFSTPSTQLDRWRATSETGTTFSTLNLSQPKQYNSINATVHTAWPALGVQSVSDHQLHTGSKSRTSDSQQDPTKTLVFSSGCQSFINFDTDSILKSSYNMTATKQQGFKSTGRTDPLERGSFLNPDFEGHKETKVLDNNNNFSSDDWQDLDKTQNRKQSLILNPLPRKSPYPIQRFSKSREPPETALDIAFQTMLDYKQPITLHRPSKANRQMRHYDYLPSIKVVSSKDQRRRDAMRSQLKEQLLLAEEKKRQEILEMESDLIIDEDREEEALQKNIFLPSGEEYEFSEGNILAATLPVPFLKQEQASSRQSLENVPTVRTSISPRNSLYDGRRPSDVSHDGHRLSNASHDGRRPSDVSHDGQRCTCSNVSLTCNVNRVPYSRNSTCTSPSMRGSKRRHSISTMVRQEKMFQVVSHWPGLQKPPNFFQTPLEPPNEDDDTLKEEPRPPRVHYNNRRRQSRVPNSKTTQKRMQSLSKGLL